MRHVLTRSPSVCRYARRQILPKHRHRKSRLHNHCSSTVTQPSHLDTWNCSYCDIRLLCRLRTLASAIVSADVPERDLDMLWGAVCLSKSRRCLRNYHDSECMFSRLVPNDVAMACPDYSSRDRFGILNRLRQLIWPDWWRYWTSDLPRRVRTRVSCPICSMHGYRHLLHLDNNGHMVCDPAYRAGDKEVETSSGQGAKTAAGGLRRRC